MLPAFRDPIMSDPIVSASVTIRPDDKRCRYWAKIIRADVPLPLPSAVDSASDVPGPYLRNGDEEILPGDFLIEGEEAHHARNRGWCYRITWVRADGTAQRIKPTSERKAAMKAAGMEPSLLTGSGDIAACIRIAHGVRAGMESVILAA